MLPSLETTLDMGNLFESLFREERRGTNTGNSVVTVDNQWLLSVGSFEKLMNIGIIDMHGIDQVGRLK